MIRVSTRGRYALRAMVDLALQDGREPVARQAIAERQGFSADYVAQLFGVLGEAGLVESVKGPGGGYCLSRDAASITALEVVEAVEGPLAVVHCVDNTAKEPCPRADGCVTRLLWVRLSAVMAELLGQITLQDLCDQARQIECPPLPTLARGDKGKEKDV